MTQPEHSLDNLITTPLSPIEEPSLHTDSPRHPNNIHVEVRAPGRIDAARMHEAVDQALHAHPLARARLAEHAGKEFLYHWEITGQPGRDPFLVVEAGDKATTELRRSQILSQPISLQESPPLQIWLVRRRRGDSLILSVHHAAADGIGCLRFLRTVLNAYAQVNDQRADVDPLAVREAPAPAAEDGETQQHLLTHYLDSIRRNMSAASAIAADRQNRRAGCGCYLLALSPGEFSQLKPRRYVHATVNDLLNAAMHKAIEWWNDEHDTPCEVVRIQSPVNLRPREWALDVFGNFFSSFPTNSDEEERSGPQRLMSVIAEQTRIAKEEGFARAIAGALKIQARIPIALKEFMAGHMPGQALMASALVSNLGRLPTNLSFGDAGDATEVWLSPPAPMPAGLGLGALSHDGRLYLTFRYAYDLLDTEAAERFIDLYRESLRWLS